MPKRSGKRAQIKRIKYQIKQAIFLNQDPSLYFSKLIELEFEIDFLQRDTNYKLVPIEYEINYPDPSKISETDPRYEQYRFRHLTKHF